ncbi:MAG: ABC-F family ATP-binding cassette domain-containing protein [Candidatus Nanopelagicales bacterium]
MRPSPFLVAEDVSLRHGTRIILDGVSLGVHPGDRIGVVGRNGGGKTTLLRVLAGELPPDSGRVVRSGDTSVAVVTQVDTLPGTTARDVLVGDATDHEWASSAHIRDVMAGLLGGVDASFLRSGLDTPLTGLSGGELRRIALAAALMTKADVLFLDEPTNHLDLEAIAWLARHLKAWSAGRRALVLVTHDRWLLDEVTTTTWEVHRGAVIPSDGGYAAFVLAKAERERLAASAEAKRRNLLRKELAWLRRGPPARTSKPRFRIDAAETLIADEPEARDSLTLHRVAGARLGRTVIDLEQVTLWPADGLPPVLERQDLLLGPGDRIGLLGPNGAGKSTFLRLLLGESVPPVTGFVRRGKTVVPAELGQRLADLDPDDRVLPWLERGGQHVVVTTGDELTAGKLLEVFGFTGDAPHKRLGDLSGGERRRLELLRVLLSGPNLLLLDEPTNDLDIETLTVLEDVLDSWPGTLVVVSHDRYFLERVCDDVYAMIGDGRLRHLPGGVDEYLAIVAAQPAASGAAPAAASDVAPPAGLSNADERQLRKQLTRIERSLEKLERQRSDLHQRLAAAATDPDRLLELTAELREVDGRTAALEEEWLATGSELEQ